MKHAASFLRAAVLVALGGAVGTASADITVISFGGASQKAQDKAYYAPFAKATGVKVVAGEYNGEQAKVKAMVEAGNVTWDVLEVESPELVRGCEEGLFEKIDFAQVGDKADFVPAAVSECGVGIFVWSTALAYNADRLKEAPTSWADFWNVDKFPGKRGLRKGAKYTLEFALLADGVPTSDVYKVLATPAGVDRAFAKLDKLKANIQWWEAGAQPPQLLASGDLVMSAAYNGRISAAQVEGKNLKVV
ncbi:MAG TPA: ABC transporter substrate-binding protein, partial [Thauera sp.]|nr:ABC transporter substrate-binding protein [Thauera sp.]